MSKQASGVQGPHPGPDSADRGQLPAAVRVRVARDMLRLALPPLTLLCAVFVVLVVASTGLHDPLRYATSLVWAAALALGWYFQHRNQPLRGAQVFCLGLLLTTGVGAVVNSVYAPAFVGNLLVMTIAVPVFGARAGFLTALWAAFTGGIWLYLESQGLAPGVQHASGPARYVIVIGVLVLGAGLLAIPARLLTQALHASELRLSELQRALEAEAATERTRRAVLEAIHSPVYVLDLQGRVTDCNGRGAEWLGDEEGHLRQLPCLSQAPVLQPEEKAAVEAALNLARDGRSSRFELTRARDDGQADAVFDVRVSPFESDDGQVLQCLMEINDVSDLMRARADLARARRMEAVGQLSGSVAHDFNNMLSAILSATDLIESVSESDEPVARAALEPNVRIVRQAAERAAAMTRKLLAIGRVDRFEQRTLDVNKLVHEMAELLQTTLGKGVHLQLRLSDDLLRVEGDGGALEHALLNLCINGRDAMRGTGTLTLSTARLSLSPSEAEAIGVRPGATVVVGVSDTGEGIRPEVKRRLFEPFFTTKPAGKGTGLGLAAVLGTVVGHGGALAVESELGHGATFRVYLPESSSPMTSLVVPRKDAEGSAVGATILVVDDEELTRSSVALLLRAMGANVIAKSNGPAALECLRLHQDVDLVLCDLVMPGMDGLALAELMELEFPQLPLVLMTGYMPADMAAQRPPAGNHPLLRKPFPSAELRRVVLDGLQRPPRLDGHDDHARSAG